VLIAPGVGAATVVLPVFLLNRFNIPVRDFALPLTILFAFSAAAILWRNRPAIAFRQIRPFLIILAGAALLTGYPLLLYGFNWIAYGNNDMCSFVMTAHHFAAHGYHQLPGTTAMLENRDLGASYWFSYAIEGTRCGADLLLAWLISLTHLTGFQIYMPLLLALHLALIAAAGALVLRDSAWRDAAIVLCAWLAVSPLNTLGTMYQLMPQVLGVTLLAISAAIVLEPLKIPALRFSLLAGGLMAALVIVYYEILPFLIVAIVLYHALQLFRRQETTRLLARCAIGTLFVAAIVLRSWIFSITPFLERQAGRSFEAADPNLSVFPYYLVPSGLANLWGLVPIGGGPIRGLAMNAAIAAGAVLLLAAAAASLWQAWNAQPAAVVATAMLAAGADLFFRGGDFGLFKLAMYIQPFLLGSLVLACFSVRSGDVAGGADHRLLWPANLRARFAGDTARSPAPPALYSTWRLLPIMLIALVGLRSQIFYVRRSLGSAGSFANLPHASDRKLLDQLARLRAAPHRDNIVSDANNPTLSSVEAVYLNPAQLDYPAADFFQVPANLDPDSAVFRMGHRLSPALADRALALAKARQKKDGSAAFDMKPGGSGPEQDIFFRWNGAEAAHYDVLESGPEMSPLNHREAVPDLRLRPAESVSNHLIAVASELGGNISLAGRFGPDRGVALYPSEPDYFFPGAMTSVGRYLLFQVLNPSPRLRVAVDYTASLNSDGENRIPPIAAIGSERVHFTAGVRGAGRLFSPVLAPQRIGGDSYLMLDMGEAPFQMPNDKSGFMRWYGRAVRLDTRRITGFVRDISVISEDQYDALPAPAALQHFPAALDNPNLEFSGIYEDGWASEDAVIVLAGSSRFRLDGMLPAGETQIDVSIDGRIAANQTIRAGNFTIECAPVPSGRHRIEIRAANSLPLSARDRRRASYLIRRVGFGSAQAAENSKTDSLAATALSCSAP